MKFDQLEDGSEVLYIHQSDLDCFRKCPEQLRLQLRDEYYDPDSDSAYIGTLTHEFAEFCLHHFKDNGFWPDQDELAGQLWTLQDRLEVMWPALWIHPHQVKDLAHGKECLSRCCVKWWLNVPSLINCDKADEWLIEQSFDFAISPYKLDSGPMVKLRGHVDFWDGDQIWDWKTSSLREKWRKERYDIQSTVYTWAMTKVLARPVNDFTLVFCPRGSNEWNEEKQKPGPDVFTTADLVRTQEHWDLMIQEALAVARMATELGTEERWPLGPTDWWCGPRWCSEFAQGKCMGKAQHFHDEERVNLTRLIEIGHTPRRHDADFELSQQSKENNQ